MPDFGVTVVVVNYRSGEHLRQCLESLFAADDTPERVVVVDNASGDASAEAARVQAQLGRPVELIESPVNLGLAGGVNLALDGITTPYLAILNPDVLVTPGWIDALVAVMMADQSAGAVSPLITMGNSGRINSLGMTVHATGIGFNRMLGMPVESAASAPHEVPGLHGAAFLIRTDMLRSLGGWDETGFLYQEDVALSWDIHLAGHRIVAVPDALVRHDYHLTMYPEKFNLLERNRWALLFSHLSLGRLVFLFPALLVAEVAIWGVALLRGRRFLAAKAGSYSWLWANRASISAWRHRVRSRPVLDRRRLRRSTTWAVPLRQIVAIGSERGPSARLPEGGLPTETG